MPDSIAALWASLVLFLPRLIGAILVLVIGWLIAYAVSKLVERLLNRTSLDDRLAGALKGGSPERLPVERGIALTVFWIIMLFVILLFFQVLNLGGATAPFGNLLNNVLAFLPNLLAAAALIVLALVIATVLRLLLTRLFSGSMFTQRVSDTAQVDPRSRITVGQTIGNVVYWLVLLLFLPAVLSALNLQGLLGPVQGMVNQILAALPNILGAVVILAVGWLVARIVRQIVANLLSGIGLDRLGDRTGVNSALRQGRLSDIIAMVVFVLIMIPVAIAALNVLNIPAVSEPASAMLTSILNAIPAIFGAFLLLVIAYFVARLVASLVSNLLAGVGFNSLFTAGGPIPVRGVEDVTYTGPVSDDPSQTQPRASGAPMSVRRPSDVVGRVVMIAVLLFAAMEAAQLLGFTELTDLLGRFIVAAWNILFGLIIFGIGLWLSSVAYRMIRETGTTNAHILATAARVAVLIFAGALALRQMGIGEDIVNLAFGLLLGAVAVAAALAFGLGGRNVASDVLERWRGQLRDEANRPPPQMPIPPTGGREQNAGTRNVTDFDTHTGFTTTDTGVDTTTDFTTDTDPDRDIGLSSGVDFPRRDSDLPSTGEDRPFREDDDSEEYPRI
jgi:hypothetical protein